MPSGNNRTSNNSSNNLETLSIKELKRILRSYGRSTSGRKSFLIARINSCRENQQFYRRGSAGDMSTKLTRQRSGAHSTNGLHVSPSDSNFQRMVGTVEKERAERESLVLWRRPLTTIQYFLLELVELLKSLFTKLYRKKVYVVLTLILMMIAYAIYQMEGPHQKMVQTIEKQFLWCGYWVGLGILSSVGLGTGLHTFLLYLGPHIAAVTLAAYECQSVDFPEPPYPEKIVCPELESKSTIMSVWTIMSKVRLEAFMWGAGTAIGELPPYFMARAARLSGVDLEDDEYEEIEELFHEKKKNPDDMSFMEKCKLSVHNLVQKVGFFGILVCASIPNPLFDLAGITCGHFLIPFWTFFGATLIGKAIIKMHIQKLFVIFMFSIHHVETVVKFIGHIPYLGSQVQKPFQDYLEQQRTKLHHKPGEGQQEGGGNLLAWCFEKLVLVMVAYFILSIFNSMAQNYHKRICKDGRASAKAKTAKKLKQ